VVADSVTLVNTYNYTEKWQLSVRGEWGLRKSVDEATRTLVLAQATDFGPLVFPYSGIAGVIPSPGVGAVSQQTDETDIDTMRWGLAGRVTHFLTRNTSGYLQLTYNKQNSQSDSLGDPSDFDNFLVTIGVQHVFQPIKLW
jgi:predicted porin